ncbi:iron hydrogenase [Paenibacillus stellifer]|uniref:Iron hydrogenase n=1 Tax=Paenibacillus stellifer TaxID=169760 RepID=A0A089LUZ8_9BACL|nr:[FeFe] hydrogenase, group A [Paenibacillus stellifer]AIQ63925.1 iron hydrogenase [Paenibacillus stellifer]
MPSSIEPIIHIDQELCTGCRRCATVCPVDAIIGERRSPQSVDPQRCVICGQCVQVCSAYAAEGDSRLTRRSDKLRERGQLSSVHEPLFAAYSTGHASELREALDDPKRFNIVQCAPVIRVSLAEEFGMPFGTLTPGKMASALRRVGFDRIYDTNFGADVTIMEEGTELISRVMSGEALPMFTSCCPAWVKHAETAAPHLLHHLSSCKSPMQMVGALAKTYGAKAEGVSPGDIFSVAVMPCTCKKFESSREEMTVDGYREVDLVITTRELAQLIKAKGIDFNSLPDEPFDSPLGLYSGAGTIFGATGGVMEAAIRTGYELVTHEALPDLQLEFIRGAEGIRTATVQLGDLELRVAIVAGLKYVHGILEQVSKGECPYHFIEVMACPEGCVSGGGQPKLLLERDRTAAYAARKASIYNHDSTLKIRKSHENPAIIQLYKDYLGEPLGEVSHHLLHTKFNSRSPKSSGMMSSP